jgi:hypothetical protein
MKRNFTEVSWKPNYEISSKSKFAKISSILLELSLQSEQIGESIMEIKMPQTSSETWKTSINGQCTGIKVTHRTDEGRRQVGGEWGVVQEGSVHEGVRDEGSSTSGGSHQEKEGLLQAAQA